MYSVQCSVLCLLLLLHHSLSLDAVQLRIGMMMTMSKNLNCAGLFLTLQCSAELRQIFTPLKLFSDIFCSATNETQIRLCARHWNSPLDQNTKNITQPRILLSSAVYLRLCQAALSMQWPKSFPWVLNAVFPESWWVHYCVHTFRQNEATGIVWKKNLIPPKSNILGLQPQSYIHIWYVCHSHNF